MNAADRAQRTNAELDEELKAMLADMPQEHENIGHAPSVATFPIVKPANEPLIASRPAAGPLQPYSFPWRPDGSLATEPDTQLFDQLQDICHVAPAVPMKPYKGDVREQFCRLHLELNVRGIVPPAFRPMRGGKWKNGGDPGQFTLSRDRLILDLHWLHVRGFREEIEDNKYRHMMVITTFDFDSAVLFALEIWSANARASNMLDLSEYEQWQLSSLVTDEFRQKRWDIQKEHAKVSTRFRRYAQRNRRLHADDAAMFAQLWLAEKIRAEGGQRLAAEALQWMTRTPEPLTKATISAKLKKMRAWLAKV